MSTFTPSSRVSSAADLQLQRFSLDNQDVLPVKHSRSSKLDQLHPPSPSELTNDTDTSTSNSDNNEKLISIIVATHYLPVEATAVLPPPSTHTISKGDKPPAYQWKLSRRSGHTAMYAGIRSLVDYPRQRCTKVGLLGWVSGPNGEKLDPASLDDTSLTNLRNALWDTDQCIPVILPAKIADLHYEGYCKQVLWPLLHYIQWDDSALPLPAWWDAYVRVNQAFAETIVMRHQPTDSYVWIHDYHLLLAPKLIRALAPDAAIGFFMHSPFPSSEIFRSLPTRRELLEGVLAANSVGFQTFSYSRHFSSTCTRVLGVESTPTGIDYNGSLISLGIFPIGIDVNYIRQRRCTPKVLAKMDAIRKMYAGRKIIIARDKLDGVAGITQKLHAFKLFLQLFPQWLEKVVLIQVTQPGQRRIPALEKKINDLIISINSQYGSLEFCPIHHHTSFLDTDEYMALLNIADLGLITAVRDGMNTSSLEYVACQQDSHNPLILSEFTGTAGSIGGAIQVNPWDFKGVAMAINDALSMPAEEKLIRYRQMLAHVTHHDAQRWAQSFVDDLRKVILTSQTACTTNRLDRTQFRWAFDVAARRLLMFDYDGTLTPIVNNPQDALPSPKLLDALKRLCADPRNAVWVISGRDSAFLDKHLGHIKGLGLSAEHGCFIRYPNGQWQNLLKQMDMSWKTDVRAIFEFYAERTRGTTIEEKQSSITWHYRNADPDYGIFQAKECLNHLENAVSSRMPVEILAGKKCLEVRPTAVNKGEIVRRLLASTNLPQWELVVCAGDDKTDEDMFRALRQAMTRHRRLISSDESFVPESGSISEAESANASHTALDSLDKAAAAAAAAYPPVGEGTNVAIYPMRRSAPNTEAPPPYFFLISVGPSTKKTKANCFVTRPEEVVELLVTVVSSSPPSSTSANGSSNISSGNAGTTSVSNGKPKTISSSSSHL